MLGLRDMRRALGTRNCRDDLMKLWLDSWNGAIVCLATAERLLTLLLFIGTQTHTHVMLVKNHRDPCVLIDTYREWADVVPVTNWLSKWTVRLRNAGRKLNEDNAGMYIRFHTTTLMMIIMAFSSCWRRGKLCILVYVVNVPVLNKMMKTRTWLSQCRFSCQSSKLWGKDGMCETDVVVKVAI